MSAGKWFVALLIAIVLVVLYAYVEPKLSQPGDPKTKISDQHPKFNLHPQIDNTDTYAIPLDSSEKDEDIELEQLEDGVQKIKKR